MLRRSWESQRRTATNHRLLIWVRQLGSSLAELGLVSVIACRGGVGDYGQDQGGGLMGIIFSDTAAARVGLRQR